MATTIPVGPRPGPLAAGTGWLWVANIANGSLSQINPKTNRAILTTHGLHAYGLTYAAGSAWVATNRGLLERIDPVNDQQVGAPLAIGGGKTPYREVGYGEGTLWTVGGKVRTVHFHDGYFDSSYASLVRVDPVSGRVVADIPIQGDLAFTAAIAIGEGSAWVATYRHKPGRGNRAVLFRVDPEHNRVVRTLNLGRNSIGQVVAALGSIWITIARNDNQHGYVIRVDPHSDRIIAKIHVGELPAGIAASPDAIWVANSQDGTLTKIDPATNRLIGAPLPVGDNPVHVLYAYGALWVADNQDNSVVRINRADLP